MPYSKYMTNTNKAAAEMGDVVTWRGGHYTVKEIRGVRILVGCVGVEFRPSQLVMVTPTVWECTHVVNSKPSDFAR